MTADLTGNCSVVMWDMLLAASMVEMTADSLVQMMAVMMVV